MLGLILIYFIGKSFYTLAGDYNKNQWVFAILGIVSYYIGSFLGGIILGLSTFVFGNFMDFDDTFLLGLLAIPFGILAWWGLYNALKQNWSKNIRPKKSQEILDDGF